MAVTEALITGGAGLLGGVAGAIGNYQQYKDQQRRAQQAQAANSADIDAYAQQANQNLTQYNTGLQNAQNALKAAMNSYSTGLQTAGNLDFNKSNYDVANYANPNEASIINNVAQGAAASAAARGAGLGADAITGVGQAIADKSETLADKAYQRMMDDRNFDYQVANDKRNANLDILGKQLGVAQTNYDLNKDALQKYSNQNNLNQALLQMKTNNRLTAV